MPYRNGIADSTTENPAVYRPIVEVALLPKMKVPRQMNMPAMIKLERVEASEVERLVVDCKVTKSPIIPNVVIAMPQSDPSTMNDRLHIWR